jgi:nicotinamide mononucleotide transporter
MRVDLWFALEVLAAAGNLAFTVLLLYEKRVGWLFGLVASLLGVVLFTHQHVYAQVGLNTFYTVMGAYGWWQWGRGGGGEAPIIRRGPLFHLVMLALGSLGALVLVWAARYLPDPVHVELDATVTVYSLLATWMLARKILESWVWYIAADLAAIVLYLLLGMHAYAVLYIIYVCLSIAALVRWTREWKARSGAAP